ncbi:uncharacterized protein LOC115321434 isoform X3 [Ixodes scapularis]|uniref:uncharacterized protein LOC115321434 isoform X3 n=1 Tax=Ixodes scapularis TaxID=6945 RepID=UPI001C39296E|nr:uncharacterized protein LOC115321434 isoform X3 [Ixodes scapularis]
MMELRSTMQHKEIPSTPTPKTSTAKSAAERMKEYRQRKRVPKTSVAKSAAQRMREYRERKRVLNVPKATVAKSAAERSREYRRRKKQAKELSSPAKQTKSSAQVNKEYRVRKKLLESTASTSQPKQSRSTTEVNREDRECKKLLRMAILSDQPSHAAAHPDYAPNLLNEPAPDLRVLMCIRKALQREPPKAIGTSDTQPSAALQPYDSGIQGSSSEMEAAGRENLSSLSSVHKLARKVEKDQAEVVKAAASQTQPSAALQPHNCKAQGSSNETEAASQDSSSSLNELARRLKEDQTEEVEAGAEDADQPTKENPSAEPQVSPETLRHVKDNLQRHLLKLKKKRKKQ